MAHSGQGEAAKLQHELKRDAKEGGDKQESPVLRSETHPMGSKFGAMPPDHWKQTQAGKEETVQDHVVDGDFRQSNLAEEESCAPQASSQGTCSIAEEPAMAFEKGGHTVTVSAGKEYKKM